MTKQRRRFKQITSLAERLHQFADDAKDQARHLQDGDAREQLLVKAKDSERAIEIERLLRSH